MKGKREQSWFRAAVGAFYESCLRDGFCAVDVILVEFVEEATASARECLSALLGPSILC